MNATEIYLNSKTSLLLIKNVSTPNIVYLSTFTIPDFQITVRDITGNENIRVSSVYISTIYGARFIDGTNTFILDQPNGLVNLSLRTSTLWQLQHTSGQTPTNSAATVENLNVSTVFFDFLSTGQLNISTLITENLGTPNAIQLQGPLIITNLSNPDFFIIKSTLNVYGQVLHTGATFVSGPTTFLSSAFFKELSTVSNTFEVFSSLGIAGTISIQKNLFTLSTLQTFSSVVVQALQATQSTVDVFQTKDSLYVSNDIYIGKGVSVSDRTIIRNNFEVLETTSSFQSISTQGLDIDSNLLIKQDFFIDGNTFIQQQASIGGNLSLSGNVSTGFSVGVADSFYTSTLSSLSFSTLGHISTYGDFSSDYFQIVGNLSSFTMYSRKYLSIGSDLVNQGSLSSYSTAILNSSLSVMGGGTFQRVNIASSLSIFGNLGATSNLYTSALRINNNLSVYSSFITNAFLNVTSNSVVLEDFVAGRYFIADGPLLVSSVSEVNSFALNAIDITRSSPFTTLSTKNFVANILSSFSIKSSCNVANYINTYASSIQTKKSIFSRITQENLNTESFVLGFTSSLSEASKPKIVFDVPTYFAEGFSTPIVQSQVINGDIYRGKFIGNGAFLSNVPITYSNLSANLLFASTMKAQTLYLSTFSISYVNVGEQLNIVSSFLTSTLEIYGKSTNTITSKNSIVALTSNSMIINNTLFIDSLNKRIGFNTSTPQYDVDISGTVYATNILYSSINSIIITRPSTTVAQAYSASVFARDYFQYGNINDTISYAQVNPRKGLNININASTINTPFRIENRNTVQSNQFGIFNEQSSIGINSILHIHNDTKRVGINNNDLGLATLFPPNYALDVFGNAVFQSTLVSSFSFYDKINTDSIYTPTFAIFPTSIPLYSFSANQITVLTSTIIINNMMSVERAGFSYLYPKVGIKTNFPQTTLDVRGNVYFSSCISSELRVNNQIFSYALI
jgi:predicted acyltransferase (DUF342 family)